MSSSSTYFSSSPFQKRVSVMVRWGGGSVVMVPLSGILKFHLYTLLEWGRNCSFFGCLFFSCRGSTSQLGIAVRYVENVIQFTFMDHKHASFQTVVNSSSQIYKKIIHTNLV